MTAKETKIEDFLATNRTQFVIPVYQRNYDWSKPQCKQLLDDILKVGNSDETSAHFIGSIVYIHDGVYSTSGTKELSIIDGQQRLTTITLIYLVISTLAKKIKNELLYSEITETYLINRFAIENEKLKLRPTENNNEALKFLLRGDFSQEFPKRSRLISNFEYFREQIVEENLDVALRGLSKLMFVEISLEKGKDDPQRIFESLNSTGLELTQSDLIRNYILMGLDRNTQTKIYENYWAKIELLAKDELTSTSKVSDFIRDFLTHDKKTITNKGKVYEEFKKNYSATNLHDLEKNLQKLKTFSIYYNKLLNPKNEGDKDISRQLSYINRLEISVALPFLLKIYNDYSEETISKETFIQVLGLVESYIWRRFIMGLPTNALNRVFMSLYEEVDIDNYFISLQKALLGKNGNKRFPKDKEVRTSLKVKDMYNINPKNRAYFLERLENYNNSEPVDIENNTGITIEHVFPQNPDPKWKIELGSEEYNLIKENYLHTIANLTLSGYNGKLGNRAFPEKKKYFVDSRLWLNKYLSSVEKWDKKALEGRFNQISKRFFEIWSRPNIVEEDFSNGEMNIFDIDNTESTGKKLEYAIFLGQRLDVVKVATLYTEVIKKLFEIDADKFFSTDLADRLKLNKSQDRRTSVCIKENEYFMEGNLSNFDKFSRIKYALTIFGFEEELTIKFAENKVEENEEETL